MHASSLATLSRDVSVVTVPDGETIELSEGMTVRVLQELGGSFTVMGPTGARFRVEGKDADAIGREVPDAAVPDYDPDDVRTKTVEGRVWEQLRTVYDPEIPFSIVEVGLIYACKLEEKLPGQHHVKILMTLTAPGCGIGDLLVDDVRRKVRDVPGVAAVDVSLTFDPPWDLSMLSETARMALNL